MEIPQPPQDEELRNIIDKLALFVARNGSEFEEMTKKKQQGNPRFQFLYGGEYYNYYIYRVSTEQAILNHNSRLGAGDGGGGGDQQHFRGNSFAGFSEFPPHQGMPQRFSFHQNQTNQNVGQQPVPPRPMSRFDMGPGGGQGQFQNFERPSRNPFDMQQNFSGNFDFDGRQQQHAMLMQHHGHPQQHGQSGLPPVHAFEQMSPNNRQQGGFDGRGGQRGRFDAGPSVGFERSGPPPSRTRFDIGPPSSSDGFESMGSGGGPPQRNRFEIGPPQTSEGFENRGHGGPRRFEAGPSASSDGFDSMGHSSGGSASGPSRSRFDIGPPTTLVFDDRQTPPPRQTSFPPSPFQQAPSIVTPTPPINPMILVAKSIATINAEMEELQKEKKSLEDQIKQSEQNLAAQNQVLMSQQQQQIEESILILQEAEIKQLAAELNIDLGELDSVLQPIIDSCTKESIAAGKAWIFTHTSTPRHYQLLSMSLLKKTTDPDSTFNTRLHIIYLVNDVLHHCMRKGADDLRAVLEAMVIPMFSHAKVKVLGNEEDLAKLEKLLGLWDSNKCMYVSPIAVEKLKDASNTWLEYHGELLKRHAGVITQIAQNIQQTYDGYKAQHQLFCQHNLQTIKSIDQKLQAFGQQKQQQQQQGLLQTPSLSLPLVPNIPPPATGANGVMDQGSRFLQPPPQLPPSSTPSEVKIPDISRPPPGFPPPPLVCEKDLMPALPYFELPAGLMVPLVKPEDDGYKPIDPKDIRLPPPCPPSERLILAVEAFYAAPSHERPRDSEGWERLGLYEYYKMKNLARKQKEDDIRDGKREKSKSLSPIRRDSSPSGRSPPRRRYRSKSPNTSNARDHRSRSPSRRSRRSRSRSPIRRSPTPPSFGMAGLGMERKIDESNKGHQLLKKMGWGGSGLGANEQGIEAPIAGGEVREKKDLYRGVGISSSNDPFESYRKSKGQAFVERMRQRADDRP